MIIDAHVHAYPYSWWAPKAYWLSALLWAKEEGRDPHECPVLDEVGELSPEEEREWFKGLEYLGIDIGIDQIVDYGGHLQGEPSLSIEEINQRHCLFAQKHPGKIYTFIGVNPKRHNAVEIVERAVKEWGAKGVKLYPPMGFYPNDRACYRLYEKCAELGIPITLHLGYGGMGYMKYANPVHLDEPAHDFPEVEFIMAHAGGGLGMLWEEAIAIGSCNTNINFDFAEVQPGTIKGGTRGNKGKYKDHIPMFLDMLDMMRNRLYGGCSRMLFGTDYPYFPQEINKPWVDLFRNLIQKFTGGCCRAWL